MLNKAGHTRLCDCLEDVMKARLYLICLLLLAGPCLAQVVNIPITDSATSLHAVLANDGGLTFKRTTDGNSAEVTYSQNWTVRNASDKPILALHEVLLIHYKNGGTAAHSASYDAFFGTRAFEPGSSLNFSPAPTTSKHGITESDPEFNIVSCEIAEQWVQFQDGTILGNPTDGQQVLSSRRTDLLFFEELNQAYVNGGEEAFVRKLQRLSDSASQYLSDIQSLRQNEGTDKAVQTVQRYLTAAEAKKQLL